MSGSDARRRRRPPPARAAGARSVLGLREGAPAAPARRRRPSRRALLVLVLTLAMSASGSWLLLLSDLLAVRAVVVEGTRTLPEEEVRARLRRAEGVPLARVPTAELSAAVAALPKVADVRLDRRWPGTLTVTVTERVPVAARAEGGGYAVLDREGRVLETVPQRPPGLPLLRPPASSGPGLPAALGVLTALPPHVLTLVESLSATTPDSAELGLRDGSSVVWGDAQHAGRKARVLEVLLQREPQARVYDVSAPGTPTTRG